MNTSEPGGSCPGPVRLWRSLFPAIGLALAAILLVSIFWRGGTLDGEALSFVTNYTADRSLLRKVFDPHVNDFGTFQARELSYFFDYLDANLYRSIIARFEPAFFVPPSAVVMTLVLAGVFATGVRRTATNLDGLTATLVLACLFSSFIFVSTAGLFYRSGKPLLTVAILAFLFHARRVHQVRSTGSAASQGFLGRDACIAFGVAMFAGLLDRQGFFYVLTACGILFLHTLLTRKLLDMLLAVGAAAIALETYNRAVAPWLIQRLNGYRPDFGYQKVPLGQFWTHIGEGVRMFYSDVYTLLGGNILLTLLGVGGFAVCVARSRARAGLQWPSVGQFVRSPSSRTLCYVALAAGANVVMFALMAARHPPVFFALDHRFWYYPLPAIAIMLFAVMMALNAAMPAMNRGERRLVQLLLIVIVAGNLANLPRYRQMMLSGPWFGPVRQQSDRLKTYLHSGVEDPYMASNFRDVGFLIRNGHLPPPRTYPGHLINLSVLAPIAAPGDSFSVGYVVSGASEANPKPLVIRVAGSSLGALGYPGTLPDPKLELFAGSAKTTENDNWGGSTSMADAMGAVGAFAFTGPASLDAAVVANVRSRENAVRVSAGASAPNATGIVIAEVYDATPPTRFTDSTPRLVNFSVIGNVGTSVTLGFALGGNSSKTVLARAVGPSLGIAPFNLPGVMADPKIELLAEDGKKVGSNDNWEGTAALASVFSQTGAFSIPANSKDAALVATLTPGSYSVVVTPVAGTASGTAILEIYEVP